MGAVIDVSSTPIAALVEGLTNSGDLLPVGASDDDFVGQCLICARRSSTEDEKWLPISSSFTSSSRKSLKEKLDSYLKPDGQARPNIDDHGYACVQCATLLEFCDRLEARLSQAVDFLKSKYVEFPKVEIEELPVEDFFEDSFIPDEHEQPKKRARKTKTPVKPKKKKKPKAAPAPEVLGKRRSARREAKLHADNQLKRQKAEQIEEEQKPGHFQCHRCSKVFGFQKELDAHLGLHCNLCDFWTSKKLYLDKHVQRHLIQPEEFPFVCSHCFEKFKVKDTMEYHVNKVHLQIAPYLCDECGKGFHTKASLRTHVENERKQAKAFACTKCKKTFREENRMKIHMERKCGKQRQFICDQCGDHFNQKTRLRYHVMIKHSEVRPYKCDQCGVGFALLNRLTTHLKKVHSSIRLPCSECDAEFKTTTGLNDHLWQAHQKKADNVNIRQCPDCQKSFTTMQKLRDHVILHQGIKPFKCPLCPHACALSGNLNKHIKNSHKLDPKAVLSASSDSPAPIVVAQVANGSIKLEQSANQAEQKVANDVTSDSLDAAQFEEEVRSVFPDLPALIPVVTV